MAHQVNLGWDRCSESPLFDQGYKGGDRHSGGGGSSGSFTPLQSVSFDGLSDGGAVAYTGSVEGKRFSYMLGDTPYANGYGCIATTAEADAGCTSSCSITIAEGSDGDPSGGGSGATYGAFGGGLIIDDNVAEGEELWTRLRMKFAPNFDWGFGDGDSPIGYRKFIRHEPSTGSEKLDLHAVTGSFFGTGTAAEQKGWSLLSEFDNVETSDSHKGSSIIMPLGEWFSVETYVKAHSDPAQSVRRIWLNGQFVFERVGNVNKWIGASGSLQTQTMSEGVATLPSSSATLNYIMLFTYWNGNSPQDNQCWLQRVDMVKNPDDLGSTDEYGNSLIGMGSPV